MESLEFGLGDMDIDIVMNDKEEAVRQRHARRRSVQLVTRLADIERERRIKEFDEKEQLAFEVGGLLDAVSVISMRMRVAHLPLSCVRCPIHLHRQRRKRLGEVSIGCVCYMYTSVIM